VRARILCAVGAGALAAANAIYFAQSGTCVVQGLLTEDVPEAEVERAPAPLNRRMSATAAVRGMFAGSHWSGRAFHTRWGIPAPAFWLSRDDT
jgi:hypothetical protein